MIADDFATPVSFTLATLQHPNIVAVHDFGHEGDAWWMALELVDGLDLRALLDDARARGERLPVESVVLIAIEIAKALAYAHSRGLPNGEPANIIHRDATASNILVSVDGTVKLADFGIAKSPHGERTRTGMTKGKAPYVAPEQALGDRELDGRVDLFALGVVLFEALAGERPFVGKTDLAVQTNIVAGRRKPLAEVAPRATTHLVGIVERLLTIEREHRTPIAEALLDEMSNYAVPLVATRLLGERVRRSRCVSSRGA